MSGVPYHAWTHRPKKRGGTDPIPRFLEPSATYHQISAVGTNADTILDVPGWVTGYYIVNIASDFRYVKLYDDDANPTVGTDVPVVVLGIPPLTAANIGFDNPLEFEVGIAIATTTGIADTDSTGVGINELATNVYYQLPS